MSEQPLTFEPESVQAIVDHMNKDHADALQQYVDAYTSIARDSIANLMMTDIDAAGISLLYKQGAETKQARILFVDTIGRNLGNVSAARGALVAMAKRAREKNQNSAG